MSISVFFTVVLVSGEQLTAIRYLHLSRMVHAGRLWSTPPSTHLMPFTFIGLNTFGMLHEAATTSSRRPLVKAIFSPLSRSVAPTVTGIGRSSRLA